MGAAPHVSTERTWQDYVTVAAVSLAALTLYVTSAAPGITWAHEGADGAELIAAAVTNGVPHPPGYPLYTLLLQAWLGLSGMVAGWSDLAWRGSLFSGLFAAGSVAVTAITARHLVRRWPHAWLWSGLAALAWAVCPLLWTQAVITEVYALHAFLLTLFGWAILVHPRQLWYVVLLSALGVAHHLTFLLLLPAAYYVLWAQAEDKRRDAVRIAGAMVGGLALGTLFYVRIPLAAMSGPAPVNWGYADNLSGLWWLVSGAAYRGYLFAAPASTVAARISTWAYTITNQYTPVGLAVALIGLAQWDREAPYLRNFSLLWLTPVSLYALAYYTRDSGIYLLPVAWLMALWIAVGLAVVTNWLHGRLHSRDAVAAMGVAGFVLIGIFVMTIWRWPTVALASDHEARDYVAQAAAVLPPNSIVVTLDDRETFALWYGAWASRELATSAPGLILLNDSLYQFDWYRRLQGVLHPGLAGADQSVDAVVAANRGQRPVFFAQQPVGVPTESLEPSGPFWRLKE